MRVIQGPNFSGRTRRLQQAAAESSAGMYLGPDVTSYLSGICTTVLSEVTLHCTDYARATGALDAVHVAHLADRNPFTLSGGEQVLTLLAAATAADPKVIAVDTILEQLDPEHRKSALSMLRTVNDALIADNRSKEFVAGHSEIEQSSDDLSPDVVQERVESVFAEAVPSTRTRAQDLYIEDLSFCYQRGRPVLKGVSASLEPGTVYVLRGMNGAGKSTLSKILVGALRRESGTILVGGQAYDPYRRPAEVVAYHFQNPDVQLFCPTVLQELAAGMLERPDMPDRLDAWVRSFGLHKVTSMSAYDLPFVARKRVALAATFAMERAWTILDEPTLGQDDANVAQIARIIKHLAENGMGIIVVTHSEQFTQLLRAKVLYLQNGALSDQGARING